MRTSADEIPQLGRSTQGVTIINVNGNDHMAAVSCEEPEDENGEESGRATVLISPNGA
jgi:hypothetical protein